MVVKREISSSPAPSNPDSFSLSASVLSHSPPAKRAKSKKAPTPKKTASPQSITRSKADGVITSEMKAEMTEAAMDNAYKGGVPFDVLSAKYGISAARLKDQFKGSRSNLRQKLVEYASGGAK